MDYELLRILKSYSDDIPKQAKEHVQNYSTRESTWKHIIKNSLEGIISFAQQRSSEESWAIKNL